jgi:L-seryl-tRNA(Ser) seleniumtransferase
LNRALRIDKLTLAALESTLIAYLSEGSAIQEIPTLRMLTIPLEELRKRARRLERLLKGETKGASIEIIREHSRVGGGSLPLQYLPTWAVALKPHKARVELLEAELRHQDPPIIARISEDRLILDLRTIQEGELRTVAQGMMRVLQKISK